MIHRSLALVAVLAALTLPRPVDAQTTVRTGVAPVAPQPSSGWLGIRSEVTVEVSLDGAPASRALYPRILEVYRDGPAERAGLRPGDVIVGLNGATIGVDRFQVLARRLQPGDPVSLTVARDGRRVEVSLVAAQRPGLEVMVPRQLQAALDSTRRVFVARLDSVRHEISGTVTVDMPRVELRRIQADSVRSFAIRTDGPARRVEVRTSDGVFAWVVEGSSGDSVAPRSFSAWAFRSSEDPAGRTGPDSVRVVARVQGDPVGSTSTLTLRSPSPTEGARSTVTTETTSPVRPLAPYVAGMNRVAGAEFTALEDDLATYFQVDHGLLVTDVAQGTPAAESGLVPGDVIVEVRGRIITSVDALRAALSVRDGPVILSVIRRGREVEVRLPR